jgi:hypothetical protein
VFVTSEIKCRLMNLKRGVNSRLFQPHTAASKFIQDYENQTQSDRKLKHSIKLYFCRNKEATRQINAAFC